MRNTTLISVLALGLITLASCSKDGSDKKTAAKSGSGSGSGSDATTGTGSDAAAQSDTGGTIGDTNVANLTAASFPAGWYTGWDGNPADFSFYISSFGGKTTYTVADPSVATITAQQVTVPPAMITQLQTALTAGKVPAATITKVLAGFGHARTLQKVQPLKAGSTTVKITGTSHHGGGGGGGSFGSSAQTQVLVVAPYTANQLAKGKTRYTADFDSADPACGSCHLHGKDGAPPHQLGLINEMPDVAAEEWITTGKMSSNDKSAEKDSGIAHAWAFADNDSELGTIAYVRQLSAIDPESLLVLDFAESASHFCLNVVVSPDGTSVTSAAPIPDCTPGKGGPGGPGGGSGAASGSGATPGSAS